MDVIYECADSFSKLLSKKYNFVVSKKRKIISFTVDFAETDFYNLAGFQYLNDLDIERDPRNTINVIKKHEITDEMLKKSKHYTCSSDEERDVEARIDRFRFMEQYLDINNLIKIFSVRNDKDLHSAIKADYIIESQLPGTNKTVYIFLRKRQEKDTFCVVSFFEKKRVAYGGEKLYWMLKEKIHDGTREILFQHKNYQLG